MNWKHWVLLAASAIGAAATALAQTDPGHVGIYHAVVAVMGAVVSYFGLTSPKIGAAIALLLVVSGCGACTKAQTTQVVQAGVDATICVLNHSSEPPIEIVKACAGVTVEDVVKILDAHKAAENREAFGGRQ